MLRSFQQVLAALALGATLCSNSFQSTFAADEELCSLSPSSYGLAKASYPEAAFALTALEKFSIATWYSDRNGDYAATLNQLISECSEDKRLSLVVYGIPNKDCEAGYSASGGIVKNSADYLKFLNTLTSTVGTRKALYVLEPDAVGLIAKEGGCGEAAGYRDNLKTAIKELSANPNAEIYLDVGYWTLEWPDSLSRVIAVVKELAAAGTIKGITINTSNYRSNEELSKLCTNFQQAMGSNSTYNCIVDTSRNYNEPTTIEWCNVQSAGIGHPPTSETGYSNLDYFMWIKPPGESDGACTDGSHASDAMRGPAAGQFFKEAFTLLWNQGYFVKELGVPAIGANVVLTPAPTTSVPVGPTPAPTTTAPETPSPASTSPVQQLPTPEPTTSSSVTITPDLPTPEPTTSSPVTLSPDVPTPAPTTLTLGTTVSPINGPTPAPATVAPVESPIMGPTPAPTTASPITLPTPSSTPCIYPIAGATPSPTPAPSTMAPESVVSPINGPTPAPMTTTITPGSIESPIVGLTPAPTTLSPIEPPITGPTPAPTTVSPIPLPTPFPTPCIYPMAGAGGDANQQASPSPSTPAGAGSAISDGSASVAPLPAPTEPVPTPTSTPASTQTSADGSDIVDDFDFDIDEGSDSSSNVGVPTPAPTSLHAVGIGSDAVGVEYDSNSSGDVKQVSTENSSSGGVGTTAGVLAVFVVIGAVAAIAAYMNSQAKKKLLEEPKESPLPTGRACEPQGSYLSVL